MAEVAAVSRYPCFVTVKGRGVIGKVAGKRFGGKAAGDDTGRHRAVRHWLGISLALALAESKHSLIFLSNGKVCPVRKFRRRAERRWNMTQPIGRFSP
jgi:hypothetical protein